MAKISKYATSDTGMGLMGAVFIVFLAMKLMGYITWSWWWVTAPLWGTFLFWFVVLSVIFVVVAMYNNEDE